MPQVDLETLVCGGGGGSSNNDRKIACEPPNNLSDITIPTYFPAESYFVSKEDEFDWYDRNAIYERKGSTKGNTNPNSNSTSSKRYSLKSSKASMIGLPKLQKTTYLDLNFRRNCKPVTANARIFAKRSRSLGKSRSVQLTEPSSPKVSCIGRVRSKRDRSRRLRLQLAKEKELPATTVTGSIRSEKAGLWRSFKAVLHLGRRKDNNSVNGDKEIPVEKQKSSLPIPKIIVTSEKCNLSMTEPPSLGGLKRFVSGRRSDSFGRSSDVDLAMNDCDSVDEEESSVWGRRGVGPGMVVSCDREWECVGPASV